MRSLFNHYVYILILALGLGITTPGASCAAPATFLDAAAWLNAIAGLPGQGLAQLPAVSPDRITGTDGYGSWTGGGQPYDIVSNEGYHVQGVRNVPADSTHGGFAAWFSCHSQYYPCLGLWAVEIDLGTPIHGFGGQLDYFKGHLTDGGPPPIPLLSDAFYAPPGENPYPGDPPYWFYFGFFGVIFDEPTSVIRLAWWEGLSMDDVSRVRFTNTFIVTAVAVPEPRTAAILAAALLGLLAVAQATSPNLRRRRAR
jgi:hypothetical protein